MSQTEERILGHSSEDKNVGFLETRVVTTTDPVASEDVPEPPQGPGDTRSRYEEVEGLRVVPGPDPERLGLQFRW